MTTITLPAPDAPAEEWGRLAVSLPGRPACWDDLEGAIDPTEFRLAPVGAESTDHTAGGEE